MTEIEFQRISRFIKNRYGIDMSTKKEIMDGRLANTLRRNGWETYTEYMNAVEADASGRMETELVNLLTTNHTYFMREIEHMDFLRNEILPVLKRTESATHDIRIWCGAASSGEEPYMIAMTIMDFFGFELDKWDTQVLATDISTDALRKAIDGVYPASVMNELPEHWSRRYFRQHDDVCEVTEELRKQVLFRQFNLMNAFPFRKQLHVVFLRNVMIYFDEPTKLELIRKIYQCLVPGGYLFVGKTETIDRDKTGFDMIRPSIFRKPLDR